MWYSKAFGSAKAMALSGRALDDYEGSAADDIEAESIVPVMLEGKIAQATLFATHAYAEEEDFRKNTGLLNARLLSCDEQDTQVCRAGYPYLSGIIRVLSGLIAECQTEQCRIAGSVFLVSTYLPFSGTTECIVRLYPELPALARTNSIQNLMSDRTLESRPKTSGIYLSERA